jgi:hypothetical protein
MLSVRRFIVSAALAGVGSVASAHHGSAISYDLSQQVTLTGEVTEWVWKNPHCFVMFNVTDEQGKVVTWGAETHPTTFLVRNEVGGVAVPLSASSIKPGDRVTVTMFPSRAGAPRGLLAKLVTADGKVLLDDGETRTNRRPAAQ